MDKITEMLLKAKARTVISNDEIMERLMVASQSYNQESFWNLVYDLASRGLLLDLHENKNNFRLAFDGMIVDVFRTARDHGWHDEERNDGECIALMHSELSEALEALRKNPLQKDEHCPAYSNLEVELADCVIRIMDYAGMRNLDVAGAILAKVEYNKSRTVKHGGKKF